MYSEDGLDRQFQKNEIVKVYPRHKTVLKQLENNDKIKSDQERNSLV